MKLSDLELEIKRHITQTESIPGYVIVSPEDYMSITGIAGVHINPIEINTKFGKIFLESKKGTEGAIII